jgi:RNA polymerase sigma-70 factor (ECF subfamily)
VRAGKEKHVGVLQATIGELMETVSLPPDDPNSDEYLAWRVQQGQRDCLRPLIVRHHQPLFGYLFRMTGGDRALADDLVQEAFLRCLKAIGQYQFPRPFKAWLYAIATNLFRDYVRRPDRREAALEDEHVERVPAPPFDELLLSTDDAAQVAAALRTLPSHQREVVILRYYQEFSLAEIAAALSIPEGTVKSRLWHGLQRLRDALEKRIEPYV